MRIPAQWISHAYGVYLIVIKAKVIMSEIILNHIVEFRFNVGKKAKFWNSSWLQEMAPSHSTTTFFKKNLIIKGENKTVNQELRNNNRNRPLCHYLARSQQAHNSRNSSVCVYGYREIYLEPGIAESIKWCWTIDGPYSAINLPMKYNSERPVLKSI